MSQHPPAQRSSHLDLAPPSTAMTYESFKPKFPLDPFTGINANVNSKGDNSEAMKGNESASARPPWTVDVERLPTLPFLRAERRVVLILGAPSPSLLSPLFTSPHLTSSLLIIASHRPPSISPSTQPFVRVLRLRSPVAVQDAAAMRLVQVLEWAERTARMWRKYEGEKVEEVIEDDIDLANGGAASKRDSRRFSRTANMFRSSMLSRGSMIFGSGTGSVPGSPAASQSSLVESATSSSPSLSKPPSSRSSTIKQLHHEKSAPTLHSPQPPNEPSSAPPFSPTLAPLKRPSSPFQPLPPTDPTQRPFDAILNFTPTDASMSDKAVLKQMILVTTLARPYVVAMDESATDAGMGLGNGDNRDENRTSEDSSGGLRKGFVRRLSILRSPSSNPSIASLQEGVRSRTSSARSSMLPSIPSSTPSLPSQQSTTLSSPISALKRVSSHYRPRSHSYKEHSHSHNQPDNYLTRPTALTPLQVHANALTSRRPGRIVHLLPIMASASTSSSSPFSATGPGRAVPARPQTVPVQLPSSGTSMPLTPDSSSNSINTVNESRPATAASSVSSIGSFASGGGGGGGTAAPPIAMNPQTRAQAQARLVRSVEAFLLSYLFMGGTGMGMGGGSMGVKGMGALGMSIGAGTGSGSGSATEPRPFILPATALGEVVEIPDDTTDVSAQDPGQGQGLPTPTPSTPWTLAELILTGALDWFPVDERVAKERAQARVRAHSLQNKLKQDEAKANSDVARGKQKEKEAIFAAAYGVGVGGGYGYGGGYGVVYGGGFGQEGWAERRAWISGGADVRVRCGGKVAETLDRVRERRRSVNQDTPPTPPEKDRPNAQVRKKVQIPTFEVTPAPSDEDEKQQQCVDEPTAAAESQSPTLARPYDGGLPTPPESEEASVDEDERGRASPEEEGGQDGGIVMRRKSERTGESGEGKNEAVETVGAADRAQSVDNEVKTRMQQQQAQVVHVQKQRPQAQVQQQRPQVQVQVQHQHNGQVPKQVQQEKKVHKSRWQFWKNGPYHVRA